MPARPVARPSDVTLSTAEPGTSTLTDELLGLATGTWVPLAPTLHIETVDAVHTDHQPAVSAVSCHFQFTGQNASSQPVTKEVEVRLAASTSAPTVLTVRGVPVLCHRDEEVDEHGNSISIKSTAVLSTR